jgi:two-component system, NtrC family, sensor histidine kinase HydH
MSNVYSEKPFNLTKWFSLLSLATIGLASVATSVFLTRFLTGHMLQRDAEVTMNFVESLAKVQGAAPYFVGQKQIDDNWIEFFEHISDVSDVLRTNAYDKQHTVVWSSDNSLIGKNFGVNDELEDAFKGKVVIGGGITSKEKLPKAEHIHLSDAPIRYVENYVPVRDQKSGEVVGVMELYRTPIALYETIDKGKKYVWLGGVSSGLFLYAMLYWIVRRASRTITQQQEKIVQAETMATIGDLSAAVAHSIRNPLASIRSSAELVHDDSNAGSKEAASDIIAEVDRVETWVRDLLQYANPKSENIKKECLNEIINESLAGYERELEKRNITTSLKLGKNLPEIRANAPLLLQVMNNLISNAIEAMPNGGLLTISSEATVGPNVRLSVNDDGVGIPKEHLAGIFKPFYTSKPKGLGLGLPLVKRIVERHGGKVEINSQPWHGTTILLFFPVTA